MNNWKKQTLAEVLAATSAAHAQDEALVIAGRRLTWAELRDNVREVARGLRALGIGRGDHVAVCMGNSLEWVIFFYAAATIGAVTVPVNTRFKAEEMAYCLKQADVKLLFITDRFLKIDFIAMNSSAAVAQRSGYAPAACQASPSITSSCARFTPETQAFTPSTERSPLPVVVMTSVGQLMRLTSSRMSSFGTQRR